ncbi:hypothetical protein FS837_001321 [Tulasnella sp. UAMH 9824]|nr:hypothetical protein FS837_001321 [Tulasnella sp. UAMH 9824]
MAEPSIFLVKAPFNDSPTGDCILQTPDGTQFVVHRVILSLASSIRNDMFSLPQASEGSSGTRPIIPVEEDPETLQALLTMVYPLPPPQISSYDLATRLVQACDKYFIDVSRLDTILHKVLLTTDALEADPLGVYALAWRLGISDEAKVASRYTHRLDLNHPKVKSDLIRRSGSVNSLLALWDLRLRRETALDYLEKLAQIKRRNSGNDPRCEPYSSDGQDYLDIGWDSESHLPAKSSARESLQEPYPTFHTLKQFFGMDFPREYYGCGGCRAAAESKHSAVTRSIATALDPRLCVSPTLSRNERTGPAQTAPKVSTFVVKPPFHSDSSGDCIVQTADGTQFVVYRVIISLASSVWNDMFSLPQPSEALSGERPVIPVDEDPETMEALLMMLYPMQPSRIDSYDLAIKLVQAYDKYFINSSRLSTFLHDILRSTNALENNPLGVYALAWRLQMEEEVKIASRYTHCLDLYDQRVVEELIRRTGGLNAVMALWEMRRRREAALDGIAKLVELNTGGFQCSSHDHKNRSNNASQIVDAYLRVRSSVAKALQDPYPVCKSLQQFFGRTVSPNSFGCSDCKQYVERKGREIIASANEAIEKFPQTIQVQTKTPGNTAL